MSAVLTPFVKLIWSLESDRSIRDAPRERILPDGCVELVFHFCDRFCTYFANGDSRIQPQSFVVGQMNRFIEIEPQGQIGFVAVRFHVHGAYRFLPGSLKAVAGGVVDTAEIWKGSSGEFTDRIAMAATMTGRIAIVEEMLLTALADNRHEDVLVDRALRLIERDASELKIADLAAAIGTSTRAWSEIRKRCRCEPEEIFARYTVRPIITSASTMSPGNVDICRGCERLLRSGALQPRIPRIRRYYAGRASHAAERGFLI
jgi:hypothetical protein